MSANFDHTYRALRLLRWYPPAWRERYGEEFIDLMEQEFTDTPRNFKRTTNIMLKGATARLGDVGLSPRTGDAPATPPALLATNFVLAALFAAFALHLWSDAMLRWNEIPTVRASVAVSLLTGVMTVAAAILVFLVAIILIVLVASAVSQTIRRVRRELVGPLVLFVTSATFIGYSVHSALRYVIARGGIEWLHPGQAVKQLAGATLAGTDSIARVWNSPGTQIKSVTDVVYVLTPFVFVLFALAVATLARRIELSASLARTLRAGASACALTMILFLVGYLGWILTGGPDVPSLFTFPQSFWSKTAQLAFMMVVTALAVTTFVRFRQSKGATAQTIE